MTDNKPDNKNINPQTPPAQRPMVPVNTAAPVAQPTPAAQPIPSAQPPAAPTQPVAPATVATPAPLSGAQAAKGSIIRPGSVVANAAARKKALFGCLGTFAGLLLLSLVLAFVFLAQSANGESPIAKLLGIDSAAFINGLITFVHLVFIMASLTAFTFAMVGLFKASMAKRDDKETKKAGMRMALISGIALAVILLIWVFVYIYLDSKRVDTSIGTVAEIMTEPADPTNLSSPIEVKFDASNVDVESKYKIVAYDWNFGDKSSGTGQITSHVFTNKGIYTVTLTVTAEDKGTGELVEVGKFTKIVSISNEKLAATFTADPESGEAPLTVSFDASTSVDPDGTIDSYEWDLNEDGKYGDETGPKTEYTFGKAGTYKIGLRVTSTTGDFNTYEKEIVVKKAVEPKAIITVVGNPTEYNTDVQYTFKADDSASPNGKITKYEWDFGDESQPATTKTASHTYTKIGKYEITLKVTDETDKEGEATLMVDAKPAQAAPKPVIKTEPAIQGNDLSLNGKIPFLVVLDASDTTDPDNNIVDYQWDFNGDGTPEAYEAKTSYTFTTVGTYSVTLSVIDADNNIGKATIVVKVEEQGITAVLTADPIQGQAPLSVIFDASGSTYPNGEITAYRWDFGDGTPTKIGPPEMTHQFTQIGMYTAKVTVIGSDNTTSIAEKIITVRETPLSACFTSTFMEGPAPLETTFDPGCTTGTVSRYFWDFGDGGTSTEMNPVHTFTKSGKFKVTLEVADNDKNTAKAEVEIEVQ